MARLIGFIGNRPDLGARAIQHESNALAIRLHRPAADAPAGPEGQPSSWGVGFYQGGEILLKRRPIDDRRELSFAEMTAGLKTDILIAHVRAATVGASTTENTHPFRYRQWLFAHTGTLPAFEKLRSRLSDSLPVFLQRDVRGETDSELLFHLFLSFLHDAGQLHHPAVEPPHARAAIRSTISLVDRLCAEEGKGPTAMNMMLTTPDYLMAVHGGATMAYRVLRGRHDIERLFGEAELGKMPDLDTCRVALVGSDFDGDHTPAGWTSVRERAIVTFTRLDAPHLEDL